MPHRLNARDTIGHNIPTPSVFVHISSDRLAMLEDEIALLSTTYVPGVLEIAGIKARHEAQMDEIKAIEQEIATLEDRIVNLKAQRKDLEKRCAVGEALLAPIRKIPMDILEEIFVQSIPRLFFDHLEISPLNEDHLHHLEEHPHDARARLGEVCRKWRNVTETAPRVWSTISLDRPLPPDIGIVDKWLRRSRSCPLDLYIRPYLWFKGGNRSHLPDIFLLLRREIPRLRFFIGRVEHYEEIHPLFPPYEFTEAPNMAVFGVLCGHRVREDKEPGTGTIHAPKIQSIILQQFEGMLKAFTDTSFSTLQRLTTNVTHKPSSSHLPTLALCRNLEFLHWSDYHERGDNIVGRLHTQVTLSALKQMTFSAAEYENTPEFFDSIRVPALENLTYDPSCDGEVFPLSRPPVAGVLSSLLQDSFSSLRKLELWHASLSGPETMELFNQLVNLDTIRTVDCRLEPPFFDALNPSTNTSAAACPRLVKLTIVRGWYPIFDFVAFIQHRTRPDVEERSPGYVASVEVEADADGLEAEHTQELLALLQTHGSTLRLRLMSADDSAHFSRLLWLSWCRL